MPRSRTPFIRGPCLPISFYLEMLGIFFCFSFKIFLEGGEAGDWWVRNRGRGLSFSGLKVNVHFRT